MDHSGYEVPFVSQISQACACNCWTIMSFICGEQLRMARHGNILSIQLAPSRSPAKFSNTADGWFCSVCYCCDRVSRYELRKEGEGRWTEHTCFQSTSYRVSKLTGSVYIDPQWTEDPQLHGILLVTDDRKKFTKMRDAHRALSKASRQEVVKAINDFYKDKRRQRPTSQDILRKSHLPTPSEAIQDT
eukprot:gb/GECG01012329.1/.p1 GENE.gb/GECG01012329.1/~~gb/GECG01012329.1/.p1  ORF type:complete len:188 (+),score=19.39 gb/GECG01012329.1/:1-564(+)